MSDQDRLMTALIKVFNINSIQALHLSDAMLSPDVRISYTYMPGGVRRAPFAVAFDRTPDCDDL